MIAYKLMRKMKDGYAPLFCGKKTRYITGVPYQAELNETKGFKVRKGFHCTSLPYAPHLTERDRVWVKMKVDDLTYYNRPKAQGGVWVLAQNVTILEELTKVDVALLTNALN